MHNSSLKTIVVGMSGGVDSSVAAYLLKQQGHRVIGMFMKNWEERDPDGTCLASKEYEDAMRVCEKIEIPCYSVNFVKEYWENVFLDFLDQFRQGFTPNPDVLCNREIKFKALLEKAMSLGADFLATGHYCRKWSGPESDYLLKGVDPDKDQSYFLHAIRQEALKKALFPIGELLKGQVRQIARDMGLHVHSKKDSTGICFIGERNFKKFLSSHISYTPGNFENCMGEIVGRHDGVAYYTLGQRKGLGIGGKGDAWFVVGKDVSRNVVIIDQGAHHPALYRNDLTAVEASWISAPPETLPYFCKAKIRYRQADQDCLITKLDQDRVHVEFKNPQRAVTPRQSIVFYDHDKCLGGAIIDKPGPSRV